MVGTATDNARKDMAVDDRQPDELAMITARLVVRFAGKVPASDVRAAVTAARRDLDGQVVPEALAEMVHQLALYRLTQSVLAGK
jgi:hypothetical protein